MRFKFLGVQITEELSWTTHSSTVVGKAQQHLYYLRTLKRSGLLQKLLVNFYHSVIESILNILYDIMIWHL